MSNHWYLYQKQEQAGPFTWEQIYNLASTGKIDRSDLIWTEGMAEWARADQIPRLFASAPPPPSVQPPVQPPVQSPPMRQSPPQNTLQSASLDADQKSSTGMEPNVAGLLCYILWWLTGLIFFLIEKESKFVRFHAMQSMVFFGGLTIVQIVLGIFTSIMWALLFQGAGGWAVWSTVTGLLGILSTLIWLASLIVGIVAMIKAYKGEIFKLPIAGNIAEKQL